LSIVILILGQSASVYSSSSSNILEGEVSESEYFVEGGEEIEDFSVGGYNLITNDWWERTATRYNVTAEDSDGDGWNNDVDTHPFNPAIPAPLNLDNCHARKADCIKGVQGFGGASEPDYLIQGGYSRDISLGDVDGDGDLDFARASGKARYLTNENGSFEGGEWWNAAPARDVTEVTWADIDLDGDIDLITGGTKYTFNPKVDIYLNENGSLGKWMENGTQWVPNYPQFESADSSSVHDIELAHLSNDDYPDMIVTSHEGYVDIYINYGSGFSAASNASHCGSSVQCIGYDGSYAIDNYIQDVDVSDFDNDGDLDIFLAHQSGVALLVNDISTNGSIWKSTTFNLSNISSASNVALGDLNGDGWEDIVVGSTIGVLRAFYSDLGSFEHGSDWQSEEGGSSGGLELADLDGDGDFDLISGFQGQKNAVYINRNGNLETSASWQTGTISETLSVTVGDIDGDGDNDIIFGNAEIADEVYLNHDRSLQKEYGWHDNLMASSSTVSSSDVNGDGYMDLFVGNSMLASGTGENAQALGIGNDMLFFGSENGLSETPGWQSSNIGWTTASAWFDYDSDGDEDLYVGQYQDKIYLNEGGNLSVNPAWTSQIGASTSDVEIADIDNDGDWDVIVATDAGSNHIYKYNSTGELELVWWPDSNEVEHKSVAVTSGDLNNDGYIDLIFASGIRWGQNHVYLNTGQGPESNNPFPKEPTSTFTSHDSRDVSIADLNGDGWNDVMFSEWAFPNSIYFYNGTVDSNLTYYKKTIGGWSFTMSVDVGDIDADGDLDIVWANLNSPTRVTIFEDGYPSGNWVTTSSLSTVHVELADMSGDGALDIIMANGFGLSENVIFESGTDGDGDWTIDEFDAYPLDPTQDTDDDGDGFGDHDRGLLPDSCTLYRGDSWRDRWGCPDMDGDGQSDLYDAFMTHPSQWSDIDGDGFGDNWFEDGLNETRSQDWPGYWVADAYLADVSPLDFDNDGFEDLSLQGYGSITPFDDCPLWFGTAFEDKKGCLDSDGDGWSDEGDDLPSEPSQHIDSDGDGWGDDLNGMRADSYPFDSSQWQDTDGDGYGDNIGGNNSDAYPLDPSQHLDYDGDGFGDSQNGTNHDACPMIYGTSFKDAFGCVDSDGDGWSNLSDIDDNNSDIWSDLDGDGFYDQPGFDGSDDCVNQVGTSIWPWRGCSDMDGDGEMDITDEDADGDGIRNVLELQAGGALAIPYDIFNASSVPDDLDGDGMPDVLDEDSDGDGFPDELELDRGSDPMDASENPMNLYGEGGSGFFYVPGEGFESGYRDDGYELSASMLVSLITSEYLFAVVMVPLTFLALMRKKRRYKRLRRKLDDIEELEALEKVDTILDTFILKGKIRVEHGLLLRNLYERRRDEFLEDGDDAVGGGAASVSSGGTGGSASRGSSSSRDEGDNYVPRAAGAKGRMAPEPDSYNSSYDDNYDGNYDDNQYGSSSRGSDQSRQGGDKGGYSSNRDESRSGRDGPRGSQRRQVGGRSDRGEPRGGRDGRDGRSESRGGRDGRGGSGSGRSPPRRRGSPPRR
jgi:hypothetical protein